MWKLASILYLLVAPTLAGVLVLVGLSVPQLGLDDMQGVAALGGAGLVLGVPLSFVVAALLPKDRSRA